MNSIILVSPSGNTKQVAEVIGKEINAKLYAPKDKPDLSICDLVGFGSGIYMGKHHRALLDFVDAFPKSAKGKAFVFSTSGMPVIPFWDFHATLKKKLKKKGYTIIGEFNCRGHDTFGIFKLIGGINKGRPNRKDLKNAKRFAENLVK